MRSILCNADPRVRPLPYFFNLAAQIFLVQDRHRKRVFDRLAEFGKRLVGGVLHVTAGEPVENSRNGNLRTFRYRFSLV